jgi:hypothetical protein
MIKVKQFGHENVATQLSSDKDRLILVEEDHLKKIKHEDNVWFEKDFVSLDASQKIVVESYYCGYLDYYDQEVRSGLVDHDIHFEWSLRDGGSYLKVYIWPAPVRRATVKSEAALRGPFSIKKFEGLVGGEAIVPKDSSFPSPPTGGTTDPPDPKSPPHGS